MFLHIAVFCLTCMATIFDVFAIAIYLFYELFTFEYAAGTNIRNNNVVIVTCSIRCYNTSIYDNSCSFAIYTFEYLTNLNTNSLVIKKACQL